MRIAIPINGAGFSQHFGQSTAFWICDVTGNPPQIGETQILPIPDGGGCGVIPVLLAQAKVNLVIAGGMGAGAIANLQCLDIETITGVADGQPEQIVLDYLHNRLVFSGEVCHEHGEHNRSGGSCHCHGGR